ncbi:hypothetical protein TURU_038612 [Turdus rufiventris]|nr:hypothetical protein TURU_038612 [Turdus rufiventris]
MNKTKLWTGPVQMTYLHVGVHGREDAKVQRCCSQETHLEAGSLEPDTWARAGGRVAQQTVPLGRAALWETGQRAIPVVLDGDEESCQQNFWCTCSKSPLPTNSEAKLNYGIKLPTALSDYLTYIFRDKTTREYRQMIDEKESARQRHELFLELTPCTTGYKSAK